jgi:hypothetical protein
MLRPYKIGMLPEGRGKKIYIVRFLVIRILRLIRWIYLTMARLRSKSDLPSKICFAIALLSPPPTIRCLTVGAKHSGR